MFIGEHDALELISTLNQAGYLAYFVGGCVRDALLHRSYRDIDIATSAPPDRVKDLFASYRLLLSGERFGTVGVIVHGRTYEVTTFRSEGIYVDHRHPEDVSFVESLFSDLSRRDFTINALAYHPDEGLIDSFNGLADLKEKRIVAIGDPQIRFREDALRILRGIRFACRFDFHIEKKTEAAMFECCDLLTFISKERVYRELQEIITSDSIRRWLERYHVILTKRLPGLSGMVGFAQNNPFHRFDLWTHTLQVVEGVRADEALRFAALYHDCGKVLTRHVDEQGIAHYPGHSLQSADMARKDLEGLGMVKARLQEVLRLIRYHDVPIDPTRADVGRWLVTLGYLSLWKLLELKRSDNLAKSSLAKPAVARIDGCKAVLEEMERAGVIERRDQLAMNGDDVKAMGYSDDQIGAVLQRCLLAVVCEGTDNTYESLRRYLERGSSA